MYNRSEYHREERRDDDRRDGNSGGWRSWFGLGDNKDRDDGYHYSKTTTYRNDDRDRDNTNTYVRDSQSRGGYGGDINRSSYSTGNTGYGGDMTRSSYSTGNTGYGGYGDRDRSQTTVTDRYTTSGGYGGLTGGSDSHRGGYGYTTSGETNRGSSGYGTGYGQSTIGQSGYGTSSGDRWQSDTSRYGGNTGSYGMSGTYGGNTGSYGGYRGNDRDNTETYVRSDTRTYGGTGGDRDYRSGNYSSGSAYDSGRNFGSSTYDRDNRGTYTSSSRW